MSTPDSNSPARELSPGQIYRRLLGYCLPYWKVFIVAALGMAVYAATDTGFAYLINKLIAAIGAPPSTEGPYQELIRRWLPLGILVLFLVRGTGEFASTYGIGWIGRQIIKKLKVYAGAEHPHSAQQPKPFPLV